MEEDPQRIPVGGINTSMSTPYIAQDGTVQHPFIVEIPESAWRPTGCLSDKGDDPSRLSVTVEFAGVMTHVTAIQVKENEDESSPEYGYLQAVDPQFEPDVERIWAIAGWEGDRPYLLEIQGRTYLLTMYPFA